jgi:hypothetical protein
MAGLGPASTRVGANVSWNRNPVDSGAVPPL